MEKGIESVCAPLHANVMEVGGVIWWLAEHQDAHGTAASSPLEVTSHWPPTNPRPTPPSRLALIFTQTFTEGSAPRRGEEMDRIEGEEEDEEVKGRSPDQQW